MDRNEAIRAKLDMFHHTAYEESEIGRYGQEVDEVIEEILKEKLDDEYEHHAKRCRECQEMQRLMDEWEIS